MQEKITTAITDWGNEYQNRRFADPIGQCNGVCGHYTAMIWAPTTLVGCGMARCASLNTFNPTQEQVTKFDFIYTVCQS